MQRLTIQRFARSGWHARQQKTASDLWSLAVFALPEEQSGSLHGAMGIDEMLHHPRIGQGGNIT